MPLSMPMDSVSAMMPYTASLASGMALLPSPWAIAPDVMNTTNRGNYGAYQPPTNTIQNYYAYPYPIHTPYPYYLPNMAPPIMPPLPPTQPLPAAAPTNTSAPVTEALPTVVSIREIAQNLSSKDKFSIEQGMNDLGQLLKGNSDFKAPKTGGIPEGILKKALSVDNEKGLMRLLLNMQEMQSLTPGLKRSLASIQRNTTLMPEIRELASQLNSKPN